MGFKENKSWIGYGVKYGGILIVPGMETTQGVIYNVQSFSWKEMFTMTSYRLGLGIGGSISAVAICAFHCASLGQMDGLEVTDWGVNISLAGADISPMFEALAKIGVNADNITPNRIEEIRNGMHYLYNAYDIASMDASPKIVAFDLGGIGAEVSVNYTSGKLEIDWGTV